MNPRTLSLPLLLVIAIGGGLTCFPRTPRTAEATPPAEASTFEVDGVHSSVLFRITHMGVSATHGRFDDVSGTVRWSADDPSQTAIAITVAAKSVDTGNAKRDQHLRGPDFFNAKQFPAISFKSTKVKGTADALEVTGDLTLLGKTRQVRCVARRIGEKDLPKPFGYRVGWETTLTIKRSDFGMTYAVANGGAGDEVRLTIALETIRK